MVSALRIAALLGLSALAQAQTSTNTNTSTAYQYPLLCRDRDCMQPSTSTTSTTSTTASTTSQSSLECQADNCLRQCLQSTEVSRFCATYTTALIIQTTAYPSYLDECSRNPRRISSACSCVVTGPSSMPSSSTCLPSTIIVTFIQTYTTTQKYVKYHA
jgi:hypothetical protein